MTTLMVNFTCDDYKSLQEKTLVASTIFVIGWISQQ